MRRGRTIEGAAAARRYKSTGHFGPKHESGKYSFQNDVWGGGFFVYTNDDPELVVKVFEEIKVRAKICPCLGLRFRII